jgi:hypothetical protein
MSLRCLQDGWIICRVNDYVIPLLFASWWPLDCTLVVPNAGNRATLRQHVQAVMLPSACWHSGLNAYANPPARP